MNMHGMAWVMGYVHGTFRLYNLLGPTGGHSRPRPTTAVHVVDEIRLRDHTGIPDDLIAHEVLAVRVVVGTSVGRYTRSCRRSGLILGQARIRHESSADRVLSFAEGKIGVQIWLNTQQVGRCAGVGARR